MSVLIKDMEKPKSCYSVIDGESEYCPFVNTDDDCVLQLKKGICEGTWEEQYSKCPLIEAPEPCDDVVSREAAIDAALSAFSRGLLASPDIRKLPSVTPKRKTEKCVPAKDGYEDHVKCTGCFKAYDWISQAQYYDFCPNCGAEMTEDSE